MFMQVAYTSLGVLIGTVWWIYFIFKVFKPQIAQLRQDIEVEKDRIENKIDEQLKKIPDFEQPTDLIGPILAKLAEPVDTWDKRYFDIASNVSNLVMSQFMWNISKDAEGNYNNPQFNKAITDKLKGIAVGMKKELTKELTEAGPEIAKAVGIDPDMIKGGMSMLEGIPEEYRWAVQLFMMWQKGGLGLGRAQAPTPDYYGGY